MAPSFTPTPARCRRCACNLHAALPGGAAISPRTDQRAADRLRRPRRRAASPRQHPRYDAVSLRRGSGAAQGDDAHRGARRPANGRHGRGSPQASSAHQCRERRDRRPFSRRLLYRGLRAFPRPLAAYRREGPACRMATGARLSEWRDDDRLPHRHACRRRAHAQPVALRRTVPRCVRRDRRRRRVRGYLRRGVGAARRRLQQHAITTAHRRRVRPRLFHARRQGAGGDVERGGCTALPRWHATTAVLARASLIAGRRSSATRQALRPLRQAAARPAAARRRY